MTSKIAARLESHYAAQGRAPVPFFVALGGPTVIPPTYSALEAEAYLAAEDPTERETVVPPAHIQEGLILACRAP